MTQRIFAVLGLFVLTASLLIWPRSGAAQMGVPDTYPPYQARYFPETGHSAVNWFLETWKNTPNALFVLGYPISEPFIEESFTEPGKFYRVQYFERAILKSIPKISGSKIIASTSWVVCSVGGWLKVVRMSHRSRELLTLVTVRGLPRQVIRYVIVRRHSEPSGCEMVVWKCLATRSPSSSRSGIRQPARSTGCSILSASAWSGIQMNLIRVIAFCSVC